VIYVSENQPAAARRLAELVLGEVPPRQRAAVRARACFLDTVIGKMSRTVTDEAEIAERGLIGIAPGERRAFLVESFRSILVSRPRLPDGSLVPRSLTAFEERDDLRPFEDAKLYGHNALHALAAYVGEAAGCSFLDELAARSGVMAFLRAAARLEQGVVLRAAHGGQDALFSEAGFAAYAEDLLERMLNPYLRDTTERVGRDPARKLGWDDRLVGVLRRALGLGIGAPRHALGAAAALERLGGGHAWEATLARLWGRDGTDAERGRVLGAIASGRACLAAWRDAGRAGGRPDLEAFVAGWRD
jgi:mannitol-1-phosphate 5-dehydrogenase